MTAIAAAAARQAATLTFPRLIAFLRTLSRQSGRFWRTGQDGRLSRGRRLPHRAPRRAVMAEKTIVKPKTAVKPKTERPKLWKVILLNDDYTPREFVVQVLKAVFRM